MLTHQRPETEDIFSMSMSISLTSNTQKPAKQTDISLYGKEIRPVQCMGISKVRNKLSDNETYIIAHLFTKDAIKVRTPQIRKFSTQKSN